MKTAFWSGIFLLFCLLPLISQAQDRDFHVWDGFALGYEITDKLSADYKNQVRLENNATQFKSAYINTELTYKVTNPFRVSLGYRFSLTPTQNKHRVYSDLEYRYKLKKSKIQLRARLKFIRESVGNEQGDIPEYVFRQKVNAVYKFKKTPFSTNLSGELFYDLTKYKQEFNRYRLSAGVSYAVTKRNSLSLSYTYQKEFNVTDPIQVNILAFGLSADITQKKDKEKQPD